MSTAAKGTRELQIGAEEEFHVVDLESRRSTPEVDTLLSQLDGEEFAPELQRSLVETNTPVCDTLDELRAHLQRLRGRLASAAGPLGLGVVAAGTVPLVDLDGGDISAGARFEHMQHEYQVLVSEQHICGAQIHVDVPDRDEAVQVVRRVAPHLPTLLAISASSPYWRGSDTGYASYRDLIWSRWPTAGPPAMMETGADYDAMIEDLIDSGTISDPGMVYFDIRPSAHVPTVELRVCDACPEVDFVVLIAGLFRALVRRARQECAQGVPLPDGPSRAAPRRHLAGRALRAGGRPGQPGRLGADVPRAAGRAAGRLPAPAAGGARRLRAGARAVPDGARPGQRGGAAAPPVRAAGRAHRRRRRAARRHPGPQPALRQGAGHRPGAQAARRLRGGRVRRGGERGGQRPAAVRLDVPHAVPDGHPRHEGRGEGAAHRAAGPRRHVPRRRRARAAVPARPGAPDHHRRRLGRAHRRAHPARPRAGGVPARRLRRAADHRRRRRPRLGRRRRPRPHPPRQARAGRRGADRRGRHRPGARPAGPLDGAGGQPAGAVRHRRTRS